VTNLFSKSKNLRGFRPSQASRIGTFPLFLGHTFDVNVENRIDKMVGFEAYGSGSGVV